MNRYSFKIIYLYKSYNSYSLTYVIISKINIFQNKQTFHIQITIMKKKKNHQKISHLSQIQKILFFRKYNCLSRTFSKIDHKFYSNVTIHNQTYKYV